MADAVKAKLPLQVCSMVNADQWNNTEMHYEISSEFNYQF